MFIDLGIPLAAIVILTPLQFWIAVTQMSNGNVISGKTLIPIGVGIVVFVALARVVWWMAQRSHVIDHMERRMMELERRCKELENSGIKKKR